jgi:hypothetical protein
MMDKATVAALILLAGSTPSFAAQDTVNSYAVAEEARARTSVGEAGYRPDKLTMVQDGNFFFTATKGSDLYTVTVTSSGKVYASTGIPIQGSGSPA